MPRGTIRGSVTVDDAKLRSLVARLDLAKDALQEDGIKAVYEEIADRVRYLQIFKYPPQSHEPMADLWTDAQRRWFFAALKSGRIQVPYRRTYDLQKAIEWHVNIQGTSAVIRATIPVSNRVGRYARYVVGHRQSRYFRERSHWKPMKEMVKDQEPSIVEAVRVAFETVLEDLGL